MSDMPRNDSADEEDEPSIGGAQRRPIGWHEFPEEFDDDDDDGTDPCPYCGASIYADGEWCPKCGKYLEKQESAATLPGWAGAIVVILVVAMVFMLLLFR
jgi:predicted nucleic acid-binding Zn ribbon protein